MHISACCFRCCIALLSAARGRPFSVCPSRRLGRTVPYTAVAVSHLHMPEPQVVFDGAIQHQPDAVAALDHRQQAPPFRSAAAKQQDITSRVSRIGLLVTRFCFLRKKKKTTWRVYILVMNILTRKMCNGGNANVCQRQFRYCAWNGPKYVTRKDEKLDYNKLEIRCLSKQSQQHHKPHLPAQNSSKAYPSTYCIPGCGQLSMAPFMTFGWVTKLSTTDDMALFSQTASQKTKAQGHPAASSRQQRRVR